jgi:translation initiation factor 1 (eIF-1/SUI1)
MSSFAFKGMSIKRIAAHTIHAREKDQEDTAVTYSDGLIPLNQDQRDLVQLRITGALGSASHGVEMGVADSTSTSFMQCAARMISSTDEKFFDASKSMAGKLAKAQTSPKWPGGVLILVEGTVGDGSKPFLAAIKAETDKGFNLINKDGKVTLELIKNMLLSQTQRLFKIGILIQLMGAQPNSSGLFELGNYRAFLFDHLLTATETKSAAAYFYGAFLGFSILASSRKQTEIFYVETKNFINNANVSDEDRMSLREALRSELKSNTASINSAEFATLHLQADLQQAYIDHLTAKGFPEQSVVKDVAYIKSKLRRPRSLTFSSGVVVRAPSDLVLSELDPVAATVDGYTTVSIKGSVQDRD